MATIFPPLCKGRPGGVESKEHMGHRVLQDSLQPLPPLTHPYKGGERRGGSCQQMSEHIQVCPSFKTKCASIPNPVPEFDHEQTDGKPGIDQMKGPHNHVQSKKSLEGRFFCLLRVSRKCGFL